MPGSSRERSTIDVINKIATNASWASFHDTNPPAASPAKIAASDARSRRVSSRRPAADASPYSRAIPPSKPSSTCPKATRPRPHASHPRPAASATPAATLAAKAAQVSWAGESPSVSWQKRSSGPMTPSRVRPSAGAKSYTMVRPVHERVRREQRGEDDGLLHLVGDGREPAAGDPGRVGVERHLLEAHAVVERHVNREEPDRQDRAKAQATRDHPQQGR